MRLASPVLIVVAFAATISGCSSVPEGPASFTRGIRGDPAKFAVCAYRAMDRAYPAHVRLTDLSAAGEWQIALEQQTTLQNFRQAEVLVKRDGAAGRVEIRTRGLLQPEEFWTVIASCS